jgi:beta-galactosidase/beta-glucuronidase
MKIFSIRRFEIFCALLLALCGSNSFAQQTEVQFLSGHGKDDAVPWKFFCTENAQSGFWTNLPVPSCWELHGFGKINYHRDATNSYDERGLYQTEISVSESWRGKRIFLVFDGSMTDTSAKLNGQSCGPTHQGAYYRFKYDVTPIVKFGATNRLEVEVAKHSANASVNGAERTGDYWMYGGIFRPVYLEAVPRQFIERVAIDAKADGNFSAKVFVNGGGAEVEAQIQTLAGQNLGEPFDAGIIFGGARPDMANLKTKISAPKLWTAETPNLYNAIFRLKQNGKVVHEISQRFGFRTFEVRDGDGLYLNGQRVILNGCDRHSFWPDSGRTLSEAVHRLDIATMKDMNMNAVRMSHYPPDAEFLDLCDELGLYVLDELGGWHKFYDNETGAKLVKEMVPRDANHPAILFWDNGNEGGFNTNLDHIFGQYDLQQRRVLHPWAPFSGVNTVHYLPYDKAKLACNGIALSYRKNDYDTWTNSAQKWIYMPTEFIHGLYDGGAGAGLADTWDLMSHSKYIGGGFIWAFLDEGIKRADNGQIDVSGNEAPDGIVGPYREREASFYAIKQIWSPIQITRDTNSRNYSFTVENHFDFTDAKDCKFTWEWRRFPKLGETGTNFTIVSNGVFKSPSIPAGGKGNLEFEKIPPAIGDALAVRAEDPVGRELWTWVWPQKNNDAIRLADEPATEHALPAETNGVIVVRTGDLTATFSKQTGCLLGVQHGSQFFSLTNGPRPAVGSATLKEIHFDDDGPDAIVSAKYDGDLKSVLWRVYNNGWIQCRYDYHAEGTNDFLGVVFDYPESLVKSKRWLGGGPYRIWKNRLQGATFGLWQNDYNNTITGWSGWIYPEFKGCFSDVRWLQLETAEGEISVVNVSGVPFMQVLTPEFPPKKLAGYTVPPLPACGLGLLDAIPAMGSKFQPAERVSPSGARNVAQGDYHGVVNFYFGKLPADATR